MNDLQRALVLEMLQRVDAAIKEIDRIPLLTVNITSLDRKDTLQNFGSALASLHAIRENILQQHLDLDPAFEALKSVNPKRAQRILQLSSEIQNRLEVNSPAATLALLAELRSEVGMSQEARENNPQGAHQPLMGVQKLIREVTLRLVSSSGPNRDDASQ